MSWLWSLLLFLSCYLIYVFIRYKIHDSLGKKYKNRLNLNLFEVKRINSLESFIRKQYNIDFCIGETVQLYIRVLRAFPIEKKRNRSYNIYVLQYCIYMLKSKYNFLTSSVTDIEKIRQTLLPVDIECIEQQAGSIRKLNTEEEKVLYAKDKNRSIRMYEQIIRTFDENEPEAVYEKIEHLASFIRDTRIVDTRNIFYKGYIFMADKHKESSLKLYVQYLNVKSKSNTFTHKAISKRMMRHLFTNEQQKQSFAKICEQLQKDNDIGRAIAAIPDIYKVKRRKIALNITAIQDAKAKQDQVAHILGKYLNEETMEPVSEMQAATDLKESMDKNQKALFDLFISRSFRLNQEEVHIFAQSNGLFKDQFIESINDRYYEQLDDLLIEEDGNDYILNEDYFKEIRK